MYRVPRSYLLQTSTRWMFLSMMRFELEIVFLVFIMKNLYLILIKGSERRDKTLTRSRDSIAKEKTSNYNAKHCELFKSGDSFPSFVGLDRIFRVVTSFRNGCTKCYPCITVRNIPVIGGANCSFFIDLDFNKRGPLKCINPLQLVQRQIIIGEHYALPSDTCFAVSRLGRGPIKYAPFVATSNFLDETLTPDHGRVVDPVQKFGRK